MKSAEVEIGRAYLVKVSGRIVPVRIDNVLSLGKGWKGTNTTTRRRIMVRSAQRLRRKVGEQVLKPTN